MSTGKQEHSIANQHDYIQAYADEHGMTIVRTYADPGKSGVALKGRDGLRALMKDVFATNRDFDAVLVYDVSRWGRFQDTDEGAHYEFVCRQAGAPVVYCAEPFVDASPMNCIVKSVKRAMAAEFSRELGEKVLASQLRVARMGFHAAGKSPFGYRRGVIDATGALKRLLQPKERKRFKSDRVRLVLGPRREVNAIRRIFQMAAGGSKPIDIAKKLNVRKSRSSRGLAWDDRSVRYILGRPLYAGGGFFNRRTQRLGTRSRQNPPDVWVPKIATPIVSKQLFFAANACVNARRTPRTSEEKMIKQLRIIAARNRGRLTDSMVGRCKSAPTLVTYHKWFGSTVLLYKSLGFQVNQAQLRRATLDLVARRLNDKLVDAVADALVSAGMAAPTRQKSYTARLAIGTTTLSVSTKRNPRNLVKNHQPTLLKHALQNADIALVARATSDGSAFLSFHVINVISSWRWKFARREEAIQAVISLLRKHDVVSEHAPILDGSLRLPVEDGR